MSPNSMRGRLLFVVAGLTGSGAAVPPVVAQTFKQIENPARFTRAEMAHVIGSPRGGRSYANFGGSGETHRFIADGSWHRILIFREGEWFKEFHNAGSGIGPLLAPSDVDVSAGGYVYVADRGNHRILVAQFDGEQITPAVATFGTSGMAPSAIAWDGEATPFSRENLYVVDAAQGRVSYWIRTGGGGWVMSWVYGSNGSGVGKFSGPSGICVGHEANTPSSSSAFTTDFYVVDRGNRRIVWLKRSTASPPGPPTWQAERSLPGPDGWEPAACSVDHFGIVYVADEQNSQIVSYTWYLNEITRYGSFGTGASNLNTFAHPRAITIPFERSTSSLKWIGDGRVLTGETFGDGSGGVAHWLGVEIPLATAAAGLELRVQFRTTGMAYNTVGVYAGSHQSNDAVYRTVWNGLLLSPSWLTATWDGRDPNGNWASPGLYHFHVTATSAYGCSGHEAWCEPTKWTSAVVWGGPAGSNCDVEICEPIPGLNVALPLDGGVRTAAPAAFRLGQVITSYAGPLFRVEGLAASGSVSRPATPSGVVASVRDLGIRALSVDVPGDAGPTRVTVRIFSLTGRLVRILADETLDPGSYVVGWDGTDASGRDVLPGVYLAIMTAGDYRGVQRLLLK